jgi:tRNA A-37 threonylcarbamoyl transferase component Bud32
MAVWSSGLVVLLFLLLVGGGAVAAVVLVVSLSRRPPARRPGSSAVPRPKSRTLPPVVVVLAIVAPIAVILVLACVVVVVGAGLHRVGTLIGLGFLVLFILAGIGTVVIAHVMGQLPGGSAARPAVLVRRPARPGRRCPECGEQLPVSSPEGLCPRCLLGAGLGSPDFALPPERPGGTTPHPVPFIAPSLDELAPHFPHLEILELIGQGGMGAVYKARQVKLDRIVALKILPPEWGKDPAFAERFTREARMLAKLSHPHIVGVHDFGEADGLYYLLMEFVDGLNLRQILQGGRLGPQQALALVPQICDALQYAHEEEVVHRDIKPENILLDRRGRVKIADFGLAKLLGRPRAEFTLTGSHQVMGTLDYMAPEQRQSPLEIDHRADIYSLGVVFYEMLTGELPLGRFAPPSEKAPVDARLDEVVFRALERDPGRRYQRASEVKTDLEAICGGAPPAVGRSPAAAAVDFERDTGRDQVQGPAAGLLLAGVLMPVVWVVILFIAICTMHEHDLWRGPTGGFLLLMIVLNGVLGGILIAGAVAMRRCQAYELAIIASLLAVLPLTNISFLLSLPMGIWALLVLVKPETRKAFARQLRRTASMSPSPAVVRGWLAWPAAALLFTGILQCVCQLFLGVGVGVASTFIYEGLTARHLTLGSDIQSGTVDWFALLAMVLAPVAALAWTVFGLWIGASMIRAAVRMTRLESYRLALRGSILAMIPCTWASLLTVPAGIWAFIMLRDPEVEAAFTGQGQGAGPLQSAPALQAHQPTGPVRRRVKAFLRSMRTLLYSSPRNSDAPAARERS